MPRVILKADNFTQVYLDGTNQFRYRIITDDRNKWSHWSPVVNIKRPGIENIQDSGESQGAVTNYEIDNNKFTIFWQPFTRVNSYDIFFSPNEHTPLSYYNTTTNNFIIIPLQQTDQVTFTQNNGVTVDHTANTFTVAVPELETGDRVIYTSTSPVAPLVSNSFYYVRIISGNTFALYNTLADANADTNRINLQSTVSGTATFTKEEEATITVQLSSYPQELNADLRYVQVKAFYPITGYAS
jgi:prolyl oligopeptidase PreP (S9A serine peptidase family)